MPVPLTALARSAASAARHIATSATFALAERVTPARDDYWCFATWARHPHTLDNPRAVFEAVRDDPSITKIVLRKDLSEAPCPDGRNVVFVPAESLAGALYLARSGVILTGYAVGGMTSYSRLLRKGRHAIVQLWHGIPLKRIGHLFPGEDFWDRETPLYSATVCSSDRDREMMASAFAPLPRERVWKTGLPRNDLILGDEASLPADYRDHLRQVDRTLAGRRMVLYAPTWREDADSLYTFSAEEERRLGEVLERHHAVLAIRGHPNVRSHEAYDRDRPAGAILSVNDYPDPNLLLRRTDVLVTDYSSIYIDFLLLDRPVIHFAYDLEAYLEERGFLYDVDEAFAGPCARTFDDLLDHLEGALARDPEHSRRQRERAARLFHDHDDGAAAEVCDRIRALIDPRPQRESDHR